jgi:hypothetical protein
MNVLLIQCDGPLPNLALMRLSTWHKRKGDTVALIRNLEHYSSMFFSPDTVYSSSIFEYSKPVRDRVYKEFPEAIVGGDGYFPLWKNLIQIGKGVGSNLRSVITDVDPETIQPDYSHYPSFTSSLGYSQRGCRLDCAFCRMKTREGDAHSVSSINALWRGEGFPKNIHLLDNDFFGQSEWKEKIREAEAGRFRISFNQGINVRLITHEQARLLAETRLYYDDSFKQHRLYTAWDNLHDERIFKESMRTITDAGIPAKHLMVYMLIGFRKGETEEEILYRFNELLALGCLPYPMVFDRTNKRLCDFQRWVLRRYYQVCSWKEYDASFRNKKQQTSNEVAMPFWSPTVESGDL